MHPGIKCIRDEARAQGCPEPVFEPDQPVRLDIRANLSNCDTA